MGGRSKALKPHSSSTEIERFLQRSDSLPLLSSSCRGRLIFALDATASREPTWDRASHIQSQMFANTRALGELYVQLCYYRGYHQFKGSRWMSDSKGLLEVMEGVRCLGGQTQIARVLQHALDESRNQPVQGLVFIGDCVEEPVDLLCDLAGQLKICGTPVFVFHEGHDVVASAAFRQIARISGGAYAPFNLNSASALESLLSAVAAFSIGGIPALEKLAGQHCEQVKLIKQQLER
ncbi:VWA domain-containing protein [Aestuariirhabdus sp. Z084]|uniref:VWA domain-containing protein n=1 Tax=Aestuariirhabdus haliotis TaxID=2918751 RepID=UPI00201B35BE|nr:VWA domain-containing protein [Aestuariirhabdus haliotis]MCL6414854.1 VWA domain-containing protein [Aestuariirhabdus haliotis]MCL6418786.1 VWA domain-containing protein [Aestuariirhabdus haliotis]